jgi:NitT/TauT family transport system ATP-binding protein
VIIKVQGLTKEFDTRRGGRVAAVSEVDFEVGQGEFITLLGPSGCGKSTVLNCVAGLIEPTRGSITVAGQKVNGPSASLGVAFQESLLMDWRTAIGNVLMQLEMRGPVTRSDKERAEQLLSAVGLSGFEGSYPWQLSGGMKQRVALCRAMIHDPAVLLLDEPFGALDTFTRDQLNVDMSRLTRKEGKTVVLVTHSISEAVFLSDRVLVMTPRPGRVIKEVPIHLKARGSLEARTENAFAEYERLLLKTFDDAGIFGRSPELGSQVG